MTPHVLIVDGHRVVREGLALLLGSVHGIVIQLDQVGAEADA